MKRYFIISLLLTSTVASYADEDAGTIFGGLSMLYAQDRLPDGYVRESLGYEETDPDWLKTSEVLIEAQVNMADAMAKVLKQYAACEVDTWKNEPQIMASENRRA